MKTTQPTIAEMNRVIAEFMELPMEYKRDKLYFLYNRELYHPSALEYHADWSWLMPAWGKLYKLLWDLRNKGERVYNNGRNFVDQFSIAINANDIASAHSILYTALLWYNTQCAPS